MHIRVLAAVGFLLTTQSPMAAAQRTGDRARLVLTISGSYLSGTGLWSVPAQPIQLGDFQSSLALGRSIQSAFGVALAGTYFPQDRFGITAEGFLMDLGYDSSCRLRTGGLPSVEQVCRDIDGESRSAAAAAISVGGIFRIASREFISPFARASAGLLFTHQSSVLTQGVTDEQVLLVIYDDDARTRVRPALGLGVGATVVLSRGYHLRWEVRDNIVGMVAATGPAPGVMQIPPRETTYKHLFSVLIGLDVILERQRGRRY